MADVAAGEPVNRGDWVQVYAQIRDPNPHPDDYTVDLFSHSDQYQAMVRRDHTVKCDPPIDQGIAQRCHHLYQYPNRNLLARCTKHLRHEAMHEAFDVEAGDVFVWGDKATVGYMEDK